MFTTLNIYYMNIIMLYHIHNKTWAPHAVTTLVCQGPSFYLKFLVKRGQNLKNIAFIFMPLALQPHLSWWTGIPIHLAMGYVKVFTRLRRSRNHNSSTFSSTSSNSVLNGPTWTGKRHAHLLSVINLSTKFHWNPAISCWETVRKRISDGRTDNVKTISPDDFKIGRG